MHLSLSVEDTNRLREKVGLKPIPTDVQQDSLRRYNKIEEIQAKLSKAAERIKTRDLEEENVQPLAPQDVKPVLPTETWLNKMKELKSQEKVTKEEIRNQSGSKSVEPTTELVTESSNLLISEQFSSPKFHPNTELSMQVDNIPSTSPNSPSITARKRMYTDPLEAPSEVASHKVSETKASETKAARPVFKPKKIKTNSKPRARVVSQMPIHINKSDEDNALEDALFKARMLKRTQVESELPHIYKSDDNDSGGIVINSTTALLSALKGNEDNENQQLKTQRSNPVVLSRNKDELDSNDVDNNESKHEPSTHLGGVANLLKTISQPEETVKPRVTPQSKEWARKLVRRRKEREIELLQAEKMYRNLPPAERDEAIQLHKQKIYQEQASDAREMASEYTPDVEVQHIDEDGKILDTKKAFKKLSREFHQQREKNN